MKRRVPSVAEWIFIYIYLYFLHRYRGTNALDKLASMPTRLFSSSSSQIPLPDSPARRGSGRRRPNTPRVKLSSADQSAVSDSSPPLRLNQSPAVNSMRRGRDGGSQPIGKLWQMGVTYSFGVGTGEQRNSLQ